MRRLHLLGSALGALWMAACASVAVADILPRSGQAAGVVVSRKAGEDARFIEIGGWRSIDARQDLLGGDTLRTNAVGHLAILFSDRTQIRLGRNTTLVVKEIGAAADFRFGLEAGTIWARAERGGAGLTVDTPAAAAAIRGTDWTMSVGADGKTSLIVLEGVVDLSNAFGSVTVAQGEAAVAAIGQAPTKIVIVDPNDREQMLYYLSVRNAFNALPASTLTSPAMRAERGRIASLPEGSRSAEDWVTLAEVQFSYDGRQVAAEAVRRARRLSLSPAQAARLDLVDGQIAGAEGRYGDAATLFGRASPGLDPRRRAVAAYGAYFARSLADPDRVETPPRTEGGGSYGALAEALTAGFLQDIPAAIAVIRRAEARYPEDPSLPAFRAQLSLLIDDRAQVDEAIGRALAIDPDDPTALEARSLYRSGTLGDIEGAYEDIRRAAATAPGSTTIWNQLGTLQSQRGADVEAERALLRSIELDPQDPASRANLAILYLDQGRLREAKAQIDLTMAYDPGFALGLVALGRYYLQTGETEKAVESLLAGSTANPGYSQALLLLAAGHYDSGQREPAEQAIENADRLDPNDPVASSFKTALAIDEYRADDAIRHAQETLARSRARGGDYAALSANREEGSVLNGAYRLQGLDAWGRYYADSVFDPFSGAAHIDQAVAGSPSAFVNSLTFGALAPTEPGFNANGFSSYLQGLLLDPELLSGRQRAATFVRAPFLEGSIGGGLVSQDDGDGWLGQAELQGYAVTPFPTSFYGRIEARRSDEFRSARSPAASFDNSTFDLGEDIVSGTGYIALRPTPADRIVAFADYQKNTSTIENAIFDAVPDIPGDAFFPPLDGFLYERRLRTEQVQAGLGWSHTFGSRNVASAAFFTTRSRRDNQESALLVFLPGLAGAEVRSVSEDETHVGAVNHTLGIGDLTLRYGAEAGRLAARRFEQSTLFLSPPSVSTSGGDVSLPIGRAYVDALYEATPDLHLEAGLFATYLGGVLDVERLEPRLGVSWSPAEGHLLRAAYIQETTAVGATTLAPVGVVGLQADQVSTDPGGRVETFAARWDAEWSRRFFTTLDVQRQEITDLSIIVPAAIATIDLSRGVIDRVGATANLWIGGGLGAVASLGYAASENRDPLSAGFGEALPFVPELTARAGLTYVNPVNLKLTVAATYVGERLGAEGGGVLEEYWTADAFAAWEPFDKRFALEVAAYNILDRKFQVAPDVDGWGQTFTGSLKLRF